MLRVFASNSIAGTIATPLTAYVSTTIGTNIVRMISHSMNVYSEQNSIIDSDWYNTTLSIAENQKKPEPEDILLILSNIQRLGYAQMNLPTLAIIGDQSSGKTTLVQSIMKSVLSPTSNSEATRKLINITTYKSDETKFIVNGETYNNIEEVQKSIEHLNAYSPDDYIHVECYGPTLELGNYLDTPGLKFGERSEKYRAMVDSVFIKPNTLFGIARSITRDPDTVQALVAAQESGKLSQCIEIITKFDMLTPDNDPINRFDGTCDTGFADTIGTSCVTEKELQSGMTYDAGRDRENKFFEENPQYKGGIDYLVRLVKKHTTNGLVEQIPEINKSIISQRAILEQQADAMKKLSDGTNDKLIKEVESLLKKFHGSGSGLMEYATTQNLRGPIIGNIIDEINVENGYYDIEPEYGSVMSKYELNLGCHLDNNSNSRSMNELFSYGNGEPVLRRSKKEIDSSVELSRNYSYGTNALEFHVKDNFDEEGRVINVSSMWHSNYENNINMIKDKIIANGFITDAVRESMMSTLERLNRGSHDESIVKILEGFVAESVETNIDTYVNKHFNRIMETFKRVEIQPEDFVRYLSQHPNFENEFEYDGVWSLSKLFSSYKRKVKVKVHDDLFTYVVIQKLGDRLSKELSKSIGVDVIDNVSRDILTKVFEMNDKDSLRKKLDDTLQQIMILDNIIKVNSKFHGRSI